MKMNGCIKKINHPSIRPIDLIKYVLHKKSFFLLNQNFLQLNVCLFESHAVF